MHCSSRIREKILTDASHPCPQDRLSYIVHNYTYRGRILGLRYTQARKTRKLSHRPLPVGAINTSYKYHVTISGVVSTQP